LEYELLCLQMLLLLKTNDCLRHIERELGSPVNSSLIAARESVKALLADDLKREQLNRGCLEVAPFIPWQADLEPDGLGLRARLEGLHIPLGPAALVGGGKLVLRSPCGVQARSHSRSRGRPYGSMCG
jgi:hypothetical protein